MLLEGLVRAVAAAASGHRVVDMLLHATTCLTADGARGEAVAAIVTPGDVLLKLLYDEELVVD